MKSLIQLWILLLCLPVYALAADDNAEDVEPGFNEKTFAGLELRNLGPALMSGRISDIAKHPENHPTYPRSSRSGSEKHEVRCKNSQYHGIDGSLHRLLEMDI